MDRVEKTPDIWQVFFDGQKPMAFKSQHDAHKFFLESYNNQYNDYKIICGVSRNSQYSSWDYNKFFAIDTSDWTTIKQWGVSLSELVSHLDKLRHKNLINFIKKEQTW